MSHDLGHLTQSFVEDCREHLDSIEAALLDIESAGVHQNPELVNNVFRLAHSIKGGAGMLGFDNIKTLAHKLENVLHSVRSGELDPTRAVVDVLLKGFDRLTFLVDNIHDSENLDIAPQVQQLLAVSCGDQDAQAPEPGEARLGVGKGGVFAVDAESLRQAAAGGNEIYLLEFDLIHDIHGTGRMPFEVLKNLADTGRIVDCKLDFATVGDLDDFGNSIPFYVLYASILEPKFVAGLVKLPEERVRHMDQQTLSQAARERAPQEERFGGLALMVGPDGEASISLPQSLSPAVLKDLRDALAAALSRGRCARLDLSGLTRADLLFFQLILCAERSFSARGMALAAMGPMPEELRRTCAAHGFPQAEGRSLLTAS